MPQGNGNRPAGGTTSAVEGVVQDVKQLLEQQFNLLRSELRQEMDKAKGAAVSLGAGAGLVALGSILGTQMTVHGLHRATGLPLWASYGLVGGAFATVGLLLLKSGAEQASEVNLIPPQTAETLKENLSSFGGRMTTGKR